MIATAFGFVLVGMAALAWGWVGIPNPLWLTGGGKKGSAVPSVTKPANKVPAARERGQ